MVTKSNEYYIQFTGSIWCNSRSIDINAQFVGVHRVQVPTVIHALLYIYKYIYIY